MSNAWQKYYAIRKLAYEAAEITLSEVYGLPVQLTEIGDDALEAFEEHWLHHPYRRYDWEWRDVVESWENRPSHFEVAIWCNAYLSGLAVGKVSDGKLVAVHLPSGGIASGNASPEGAGSFLRRGSRGSLCNNSWMR